MLNILDCPSSALEPLIVAYFDMCSCNMRTLSGSACCKHAAHFSAIVCSTHMLRVIPFPLAALTGKHVPGATRQGGGAGSTKFLPAASQLLIKRLRASSGRAGSRTSHRARRTGR